LVSRQGSEEHKTEQLGGHSQEQQRHRQAPIECIGVGCKGAPGQVHVTCVRAWVYCCFVEEMGVAALPGDIIMSIVLRMCCVIVIISDEDRPTDRHEQAPNERKPLKRDERSSLIPGRLAAYNYDTKLGDWIPTRSDDEGNVKILQ